MTTEQDCLDALREAARKLDESPSKAQYEDLGLTPSASTILRVVGGWNAAKEKAGLETTYSRGSRVQEKPDAVDLPRGTEWEELSQDQRWHYKNREWNTERSMQRRESNRAWANDLQRRRGGCSRCDEDDPVCLDFHHLDGAEKKMSVGKMIAFGYGKDRIEAEIEKCIVLCANCHRKEHYDDPSTE